jgi:PA14 domain
MEMWNDAANGGAASLFWESANQARELVPTTQLYPATKTQTKFALSASATQLVETDTAGITFTVTRDGDTAKAFTLDIKTGGDAISGVHFAPVPATLTLPAGSAKATITLIPLRSKKLDGDKTVSLSIPAAGLYNVSGGTQTVVIKDADLPPAGTGTGLKADYYDDRAAKTLKGTRLDAQVSFAWDIRAPYPGIVLKKTGRETDGFAAHWTGEIQPFFSENYQLELAIGNYSGARLYIGDKLLIDNWKKGQLAQATIDLDAGKKYPIRIEFEHRNTYDARIQLKWKSATQYEQVVPTTQLYSAQ